MVLIAVVLAGCPRGQAPATREVRPSAPTGGTGTAPPKARVTEPSSTGSGETIPGHKKLPAMTPLELHRAALVIDTHSDAPLRITDEAGFDYGKRSSKKHTDLVRMKQGGLDAEFLAVWVYPKRYPGAKAWVRARSMFAAIHRTIRDNPNKARMAHTAADIRTTAAAGKIALLIGVEGAHSIGRFDDTGVVLDRVRWMYRYGARYMTLTWMNSNPLAGSSGDSGRTRGLSPLGRKVVKLMNDLGMMVDLSHVSDRTFRDVLAISRLPVIASHSAARALAGHYRNITDDMLRALAKNKGVMCVNFFAGYLSDQWMRKWKKVRKKKGARIPVLPLGVLVDHIDHVVKVAGVDHVCLGSDYDGVPVVPAGLDDASGLPAITVELVRRGYKVEEIYKILGLNVLRVMEANEKGAVK